MDERPAALVRRYGELYSQLRLETLDALDKLTPLVNSDELKIKLLFSVVVVSFLGDFISERGVVRVNQNGSYMGVIMSKVQSSLLIPGTSNSRIS